VAEGPIPDSNALRQQVDEAFACADYARAHALLTQLWQLRPDASTAAYLVGRFEKLRGHIALAPCRLAILRSFTVEPAIGLLRAMAFAAGIDLEVHLGDFNTYFQEMLDAASTLYAFRPDVVILAVQACDIVPDLWTGFADLDAAGVQAAKDRTAATYRQIIETFRSRCPAHIILHSLQIPSAPALGVLDATAEHGQSAAFRQINDELAHLARAHKNVYLFDYDRLIARRGEAAWSDPRKWLTARLPIAAGELVHLARAWMRFLHPITGKVCKALVVDLDNTLWGGVIGEDGLEGIKLDEAYPGAAFQAVQRTMLDLYRRGIILAICSKNNPAEALEAIAQHRGMLLRPEHFAAVRINWNDKATNLREIAGELNIGIDSLAFMDDNPVERTWVREQLPEVTVLELPADPMGFAPALRDSPVFERLAISEEDRERGRMYAEQRQRAELQATAGSLEDFYRSLQMSVEIALVTPATLARTAQLTQKTNQFNLTTKRYTEQQIAELSAAPGGRVYNVRVADRFGDNGLVGVVITRQVNEDCEVDTFLLSCRVIGRTVETAILAIVAQEAAKAGAKTLGGWFVPSKKNAPAKDFYRQHALTSTREKDGATWWQLPLPAAALVCPAWIDLRMSPGETK